MNEKLEFGQRLHDAMVRAGFAARPSVLADALRARSALTTARAWRITDSPRDTAT